MARIYENTMEMRFTLATSPGYCSFPPLWPNEVPMPAAQIRVVLADDHPLVRAGFQALLSPEEDIEIVGEAATALDAYDILHQETVDVVLLDISMSGPSPTAVLDTLRRLNPMVSILVISAYDDDAHVSSLIRAGANGYLLKDDASQWLSEGVRKVYGGEQWLSPTLQARYAARHQVAPPLVLNWHEQSLLAGMAAGWTQVQLGKALQLTPVATRRAIARLFRKLKVSSRRAAVAWAHHNLL